MNVLRYILFISIAFFACLAPSCISDEFTDSPEATLSFSTDTVSFGTVFTDLTTPTARLLVFNRNSKGVNISSIRFQNPDSPFRMNVDGVSGSSFSDVEIRGNDSIYVFLECYLEETDSSVPQLTSDKLEFVTNGVTQTLEVEAWGWNVTRLPGVTISEDTRFTAEKPYIIFDTLTVNPGATLIIDPGAWILFHDKAAMNVKGTLLAQGAQDRMIRMSGDRLDDVLPDTPYDLLAGQWGGINIAPESFGNRIEYVDMRSTVSGLQIDSCGDISKSKLVIFNSWLHNSQGNVLNSKYAAVDAYGCCFSDAAGAVVKLTGGRHRFIQCTIANAYLFSSLYQPNLMLSHCLPDESAENTNPLMEAAFENCIIWGEIGEPIQPGDLTGSDVFMRYVLFKADGTDDSNFINCIWNENPLYLTIRDDYYFNYRLQPDSPAIGRGNPAYVNQQTILDMDGLNRLANGNPTLGAYAN